MATTRIGYLARVSLLLAALLSVPGFVRAHVAGEEAPVRQFGIATGGSLHELAGPELARYLDGVNAVGARWIRLDINWDVIQPRGRASFRWEPFDRVVRAARARGIDVLGLIVYTPPWARPARTTHAYPPTNLTTYSRFANAAASHFAKAGVHAYEVWNEPNVAEFWRPAPQPVRYARMLQLASAAIKAADPAATVVSGGLAPSGARGASDGHHLNPLDFLEAIYANGAGRALDAVGWHPYTFPHGLTFAPWSAWSQIEATHPSAITIMSAAGDGDKKIWITEFGAPTGTASGAFSEGAQARFIRDAFALLGASSWAGPAFLYTYRDAGSDVSDTEHNFGIVRRDWSPKPAYAAYRAATAG